MPAIRRVFPNLVTYIQHMRKSHNDYMHNAHMQHARAMHVYKIHTFCILVFCTYFAYMQKIYIFGAAHILRICPIFCKFYLHICKFTLNNKLHTCVLCAKYSQQYVQNVCSIFVRVATPPCTAPPHLHYTLGSPLR